MCHGPLAEESFDVGRRHPCPIVPSPLSLCRPRVFVPGGKRRGESPLKTLQGASQPGQTGGSKKSSDLRYVFVALPGGSSYRLPETFLTCFIMRTSLRQHITVTTGFYSVPKQWSLCSSAFNSQLVTPLTALSVEENREVFFVGDTTSMSLQKLSSI